MILLFLFSTGAHGQDDQTSEEASQLFSAITSSQLNVSLMQAFAEGRIANTAENIVKIKNEINKNYYDLLPSGTQTDLGTLAQIQDIKDRYTALPTKTLAEFNNYKQQIQAFGTVVDVFSLGADIYTLSTKFEDAFDRTNPNNIRLRSGLEGSLSTFSAYKTSLDLALKLQTIIPKASLWTSNPLATKVIAGTGANTVFTPLSLLLGGVELEKAIFEYYSDKITNEIAQNFIRENSAVRTIRSSTLTRAVNLYKTKTRNGEVISFSDLTDVAQQYPALTPVYSNLGNGLTFTLRTEIEGISAYRGNFNSLSNFEKIELFIDGLVNMAVREDDEFRAYVVDVFDRDTFADNILRFTPLYSVYENTDVSGVLHQLFPYEMILSSDFNKLDYYRKLFRLFAENEIGTTRLMEQRALGQFNQEEEFRLLQQESVDSSLPDVVNLLATDGTDLNGVRVSWRSVSGATDYRLIRCDSLELDPDCKFFPWVKAPSTEYYDTSAERNQVYYYRALACDLNADLCSESYSLADSGYVGQESLDAMRWVSQTVPDNTRFKGGEIFQQQFTVQNVGDTVWNQNYCLVHQSGPVLSSDLTGSACVSGTVSYGELHTFTLSLKAPAASANEKTYTEYWALSKGGQIVSDAIYNTINVLALDRDEGTLVSQLIPDDNVYEGGETVTQRFTVKNSGNTTWNSSYCLKRQSQGLFGSNNPVCVQGEVSPNGQYNFTFNINVPANGSLDTTYRDSWSLIKNGYPVGASIVAYTEFVVRGIANVPQGLSAVATNSTTVDLSWPFDNTGYLYKLFRSNSVNGSYSRVDILSTLSYRDRNLNPDSTYFYKLQRCVSDAIESCSELSSAVSVTTPPAAQVNSLIAAFDVVGDGVVGTALTLSANIYNGGGLAQDNRFGFRFALSSDLTIGSDDTVLLGDETGDSFYLPIGQSLSFSKVYTLPVTSDIGSQFVLACVSYVSDGAANWYCENYPINILSEAINIPNTPAKPSVSYQQGGNNISVGWNSVTGGKYYRLERKIDSSGSFAQVYAGPLFGFVDQGITDGRSYSYRLKSCQNELVATCSAASSPAVVETLGVASNDFYTSGLKLSRVDNEFSLEVSQRYSGNSAELLRPMVGFYLSSDDDCTVSDILLGTSVSGLNSADTVDSERITVTYPPEATVGTWYACAISDPDDSFPETNEANNSVTSLARTDVPVPSLKAWQSAVNGTIKLNWDVVPGTVSYRLSRSSSAEGPFSYQYIGTSTEYDDNGLLECSAYFYKLESCNGTSSNALCSSSAVVSGSTLPNTSSVPSAEVVSENSVRVSWGNNACANYFVLRREDESGSSDFVYAGNDTEFFDQNLVTGQTYTYQLSECRSESGYFDSGCAYIGGSVAATPEVNTAVNTWQAIQPDADLESRVGAGTAVFGNKLISVGGRVGEELKNDIWFSEDGQDWYLAAPDASFSPRLSGPLVVHGERLYMLGGVLANNERADDVWSSADGIHWDLETDNPQFPSRSRSAAAISWQGKIWIIGGAGYANSDGSFSGHLADIWSSVDGKVWSQVLNEAPFGPQGRPRLLVIDDTLMLYPSRAVVVDSIGSQQEVVNDAIWSSTDGMNWTKERDNLPYGARDRHSVIEFGGRYWLIGGTEYSTYDYVSNRDSQRFDARSYYQFRYDVWTSNNGLDWSVFDRVVQVDPSRSRGALNFNNRIWLGPDSADRRWTENYGIQPLPVSSELTITGSTVMGGTLQAARPTGVPASAILTYQWFKNNEVLPLAVGETFYLGDDLVVGDEISVRARYTTGGLELIEFGSDVVTVGPTRIVSEFLQGALSIRLGSGLASNTLSFWQDDFTVTYSAEDESVVLLIGNGSAVDLQALSVGTTTVFADISESLSNSEKRVSFELEVLEPLVDAPFSVSTISPADGNIVSADVPLLLQFFELGNAERYHVQVYNEQGALTFSNANVAKNSCSDGVCSVQVPAMSPQAIAHWRVRANNAGGWGSWSGNAVFGIEMQQVPEAPTTVSPANGTRVQADTSIILSFNAVSNAERYHVQVFDDQGALAISNNTVRTSLCNLGVCSLAVAGLPDQSNAYWRVRGYNGMGWGGWSGNALFNVGMEPLTPPAMPTTVSPAGGESVPADESISLIFNELANAGRYHVQLYDGQAVLSYSNSTVRSGSCSNGVCRVDVAGMPAQVNAYWRVRGNNESGWGPWSDAAMFNIDSPQVPEKITVLTPKDGVYIPEDTSISLRFDEAPTAEQYHVQLYDGQSVLAYSNSSVRTAACTQGVCSLEVAGMPAQSAAYWRVRGRNAGGWGEWSDNAAFNVGSESVTPPEKVVTLSPKGGANVTPNDPIELRFEALSSADRYHVQLYNGESALSYSSSTVRSSNCVEGVCSVEVSGLPVQTSAYWRVRAYNEGGWGAWSDNASFNIGASQVPEKIVVVLPKDDAYVAADAAFFLSFIDAPNADRYHVQRYNAQEMLTYSSTTFRSSQCDDGVCFIEVDAMPAQEGAYWRVRGYNIAGWGAWSDNAFFNVGTEPVARPDKVTILSPVNGFNVPEDEPIVLSFNEVSNAVRYHVQQYDQNWVLTYSNTRVRNTNCSDGICSAEANGMSQQPEAYWRVRGYNEGGWGQWSDNAVFSVGSQVTSPPQQAVTVSPKDGESVLAHAAISLRFSQIPNAVRYHVQRFDGQGVLNFSNTTIRDTNCNEGVCSIMAAGMPAQANAYWRVRGYNSEGWGPWSDEALFNVQQNNQIVAGELNSCLLDQEQGVQCWGSNSAINNVPQLLNPFMLDMGFRHACALDSTGVVCWGDNRDGQLDVPDLVNPFFVSTGNHHSCAIDENGAVCWGLNSAGQLDVPVMDDPLSISSDWFYNCGIDVDEVVCWGQVSQGVQNIPELETPTMISTGAGHSCALHDGGVSCWGNNQSQQVTVPALNGPTLISAGNYHTCALDNTGVVCWGRNDQEQTDVPSLINPYFISAGADHSCALDALGWSCWGSDTYGQLGTSAD